MTEDQNFAVTICSSHSFNTLDLHIYTFARQVMLKPPLHNQTIRATLETPHVNESHTLPLVHSLLKADFKETRIKLKSDRHLRTAVGRSASLKGWRVEGHAGTRG